MKLPNGYGSVYKLPGKRRKPWAVRLTLSKTVDDTGVHWKYKYLGYYESKAEALTSLVKYNQNPYDLDTNNITFKELYDLWAEDHYPKISTHSVNCYKSAYKALAPLESMRFTDIRKSHLQHTIDASGKNYPTLVNMKIILTQMFTYAMENDICQKNYATFVDINQYKSKNPDSITRMPFTNDEIQILWNCSATDLSASIVLMMIYTGCRIGELLNLRKEDIDIQERCFHIRQAKTNAGVRIVPISKKIMPFFQSWLDRSMNNEYLMSTSETHITYHSFLTKWWRPLMESHGMEHRPHDTRHTCVSMLTAAKVDDKIIKRIVGHKGSGVTELVYTHFDLEQLWEAIDAI